MMWLDEVLKDGRDKVGAIVGFTLIRTAQYGWDMGCEYTYLLHREHHNQTQRIMRSIPEKCSNYRYGTMLTGTYMSVYSLQ